MDPEAATEELRSANRYYTAFMFLHRLTIWSFVLLVSGLLIACADLQLQQPAPGKLRLKILERYQVEFEGLTDQIRSFHHADFPEISPRHARVHARLGIICYESGEYREAEYNLTRSIQMVESGAQAHLYLGRVYRKMNQFEKAEKELGLALQYDGTMIVVHKELGDLYQVMGREQEAQAAFQRFQKAIAQQ